MFECHDIDLGMLNPHCNIEVILGVSVTEASFDRVVGPRSLEFSYLKYLRVLTGLDFGVGIVFVHFLQ